MVPRATAGKSSWEGFGFSRIGLEGNFGFLLVPSKVHG